MKRLVFAILLAVGALNLFPIVGSISAEQIFGLYGTAVGDPNLLILMRHRAIMLGLLGAFLVYSAFNSSVRTVACIAGITSMLSFVFLAYSSGDFGDEIRKVVLVDIAGSIALSFVLAGRLIDRNTTRLP